MSALTEQQKAPDTRPVKVPVTGIVPATIYAYRNIQIRKDAYSRPSLRLWWISSSHNIRRHGYGAACFSSLREACEAIDTALSVEAPYSLLGRAYFSRIAQAGAA